MKIIPIKNDYALTHNDAILYKTMPDLSTTLSSNSWYMIKLALDNNFAPQEWLGQTKLNNGREFMLVDMTPNRYEKVGGGYTGGVFLEKDCKSTTYKMNSTDTNLGGFGESELRTLLNTTILNRFSVDLKRIIPKCKVLSGIGGVNNQVVASSENYLFLPSDHELDGGNLLVSELEAPSGPFDYYKLGAHSAAKYIVNTQTVASYWTRSASGSDNTDFQTRDVYGWDSYNPASSEQNIAICFAL